MPACRIPTSTLRAVQQDPTRLAKPQVLGWWFAVNLKKIVGFLVVIFVLFWIISQPTSASGSVNNLLGNLQQAGSSIATFLTNVF